MWINTFRGPYVDRTEGSQTILCQPRVHRRCRKDHRHRDPGFRLTLIGQNDVPSARAHGIFRFRPDPLQASIQRPSTGFKSTVDHSNAAAKLFNHRVKFGIAHERTVEHQNLRLAAAFIKHVLQVAKTRLQRHHATFAQAVDRRVCDLREVLTEEVAEWAIGLGQNRRWRVVPH